MKTPVQVPVSALRRAVRAMAEAEKSRDAWSQANDALVYQVRASGIVGEMTRRAAIQTEHAMHDKRAVALMACRALLGDVLRSCGLDLDQLVEAQQAGDLEALLRASLSAEAAE